MTNLSTAEVAARTGLSEHTLRWYERIGLLDRIERGPDGRRRFSEGDLGWLDVIARLRETGMPVREMQRYAELVRDGAGFAERIAIFTQHREHVRAQLRAQQRCLELLDQKIAVYNQALINTPEAS
jgi:DNA-binding transcriptional MerR regulator